MRDHRAMQFRVWVKDGIRLVQLHLSDVHIAEAVTYKGMKLLRCFHQPLKHNVRVRLGHSGSGTPSSSLVHSRQDAYDRLHWHTLAVTWSRALPTQSPHRRCGGMDARVAMRMT